MKHKEQPGQPRADRSTDRADQADQAGRPEDMHVQPLLGLSPLVVIGAVLILAAIVLVMAYDNANRGKDHMSRILGEKGAALIRSFEAGTRTGLGMRWGAAQLQLLLEEMARQPGILYLYVTDASGVAIAHSDSRRIGERAEDKRLLASLDNDSGETLRLRESAGDGAFVVYRRFYPLLSPSRHRRFQEVCPVPDRGRETLSLDSLIPGRPGDLPLYIFLGLDPAPFEEARTADLRTMLITSAVLLVLGMGGVVSLFWAQSSRLSARLLRHTRAFASQVVKSMPVGLVTSGQDGRIALLNPEAERLLGRRTDEVVGRSAPEFLSGAWGEKGLAGSTEIESYLATADGVLIPVGVKEAPIRDDDGSPLGTIHLLRDLREVKKLEEEVRRREKLAALGSLAAGVAHEIRNPLSSIKGFATYLRDLSGDEGREAAQIMIREVDRLNRVIGELLEFARPSDLMMGPTDLAGLIDHSLQLIRPDARLKGIEVHSDIAQDLPRVEADPDRLTQALLNLYLNSIQAMDQAHDQASGQAIGTSGGVIEVSARGEAGQVRIVVSDSGPGIPPAMASQIFNPYFTTKPSGTGLGLALVHKIIEAHGGTIELSTRDEPGARFDITLPASQESA